MLNALNPPPSAAMRSFLGKRIGEMGFPEMILTQEEVEILKQLKAAGGTGRSVSALNAHDGLKRLIKVGYDKGLWICIGVLAQRR